jgi:uncharacterized protein YozE (UPF0346 family)
MSNIHAGLKWETIINRANQQEGFEKYRLDDAYGNISEYSEDQNCYLFLMKTFSGTTKSKMAKKEFIEECL